MRRVRRILRRLLFGRFGALLGSACLVEKLIGHLQIMPLRNPRRVADPCRYDVYLAFLARQLGGLGNYCNLDEIVIL